MGMDNSVTSLTIKQIQPNYCSFDLLCVKLRKMIIVALSLWLQWEIFNNLEYVNGTTCLMFVI